MFFVAEEVREFMAQMGFRTFKEMVGRTDMLEFADMSGHWKAKHLDLSTILYQPSVSQKVAVHNVTGQDHGLDGSLDNKKLIPAAAPAIERGEKVTAELPIQN